MGEKKVLAVMRVYPESDQVDVESMAKRLETALPPGHRIGRTEVEEVAFGLKCLRIFVVMPEQTEGGTDPLEQALAKVDGVGRVETETVTRYRRSTRKPPLVGLRDLSQCQREVLREIVPALRLLFPDYPIWNQELVKHLVSHGLL